jgi:hypothetical protein
VFAVGWLAVAAAPERVAAWAPPGGEVDTSQAKAALRAADPPMAIRRVRLTRDSAASRARAASVASVASRARAAPVASVESDPRRGMLTLSVQSIRPA